MLLGCENKKEYKIIDISGEEFINNIEEGKSFLVFMYSDNSTIYNEKLDEVKRIAETSGINIYHLDRYRLDVRSEATLDHTYSLALEENVYIAIQNGKIETPKAFSNYRETMIELEQYTFNDELILSSEEANEENIKEGEKYYNEGNIYLANQYFSKAWSSAKARDFVAKHNEFNILHYWERYEIINNEKNEYKYIGINTFTADSKFGKIVVENKKNEEFLKPGFYEADEKNFYKVQNNKIYVGKTEDKLEEKFKIKYLDKTQLVIEEIKTGKEYQYARRD